MATRCAIKDMSKSEDKQWPHSHIRSLNETILPTFRLRCATTPGREAWKQYCCTAVLHKNGQKMDNCLFTGAFCQMVRLTSWFEKAVIKAGSLQCGFWPRSSQIPIWISPWIFWWMFSPLFPRKKARTKITQDFVRINSPRISAEAFSWQLFCCDCDFFQRRRNDDKNKFWEVESKGGSAWGF